MLDEGNNPNLMETPEAPPPEEGKNNRTFWLVGGVLAGLVFLTLVCMAVYFFYIAPNTAQQRTSAQQTIEAGNAQAISQLTQTAAAALLAQTPQASPLPLETGTLAATSTPVIAQNTAAATPTSNSATVMAIQTQLSYQMTSTGAAALPTVTSSSGAGGMPATGFFDQIGLPTLIILAVVLVAIIFLARRMRKSPAK